MVFADHLTRSWKQSPSSGRRDRPSRRQRRAPAPVTRSSGSPRTRSPRSRASRADSRRARVHFAPEDRGLNEPDSLPFDNSRRLTGSNRFRCAWRRAGRRRRGGPMRPCSTAGAREWSGGGRISAGRHEATAAMESPRSHACMPTAHHSPSPRRWTSSSPRPSSTSGHWPRRCSHAIPLGGSISRPR